MTVSYVESGRSTVYDLTTCYLLEHAVFSGGLMAGTPIKLSEKLGMCSGQLIRAHIVPQQQLKRVGRDVWRSLGFEQRSDMIWDARLWVPACGGWQGNGGHHGMLDHTRTITLPRSAIAEETEELVAQLGLTWWLDREYGER